jgi:hypothetical protein
LYRTKAKSPSKPFALTPDGPVFGNSHEYDILLGAYKTGWSDIGHSYKHPQFERDSKEAMEFLAGSSQFTIRHIEVFAKRSDF